jgi:hypothetical protein
MLDEQNGPGNDTCVVAKEQAADSGDRDSDINETAHFRYGVIIHVNMSPTHSSDHSLGLVFAIQFGHVESSWLQ